MSTRTKSRAYSLGTSLGILALAGALAFSNTALAQTAAVRPPTNGPASVADLAAGLLDAVVNISTSQKVKNDDDAPTPQVPEGSPYQPYFDEFFKGRVARVTASAPSIPSAPASSSTRPATSSPTTM